MPPASPLIGLNLLHLVPGETGGSEVYVRRLLPALLKADSRVRFVAFASREGAPSLLEIGHEERLSVRELPIRSRNRVARVMAEQLLLPAAATREGVSLLHNLFSTAPATPPCPQVTTVLDLIYQRFPETHSGWKARGMASLVPLAARRSRRILTISQSVKDDVVSFLDFPEERVDVTLLGPGMDPSVLPLPEADLRALLKAGDSPLLLSVSARRPHKNLPRLLAAFARIAPDHPGLLVLPGYATGREDELATLAESLGIAHRVRFLGWVEDSVLEGLYRASTLLAFPSLAEGFGLPVLEAMSRGLPVACSRTSSLPEVGGDAVAYFDPESIEDMASTLGHLLVDPSLRLDLAARGRERSLQFTWEACARSTLQSYRLGLTPGDS